MFRSATALTIILGLSLLTGCDPKKQDGSAAAGAASGAAAAGTPVPTPSAPDGDKDGTIGNKTISQGSAGATNGSASAPGASNNSGTGTTVGDWNGATSALDKIDDKIH